MQKLALIALAGSLGTLARYGLAGLVQRWAGLGFPWGTAAVNVLGSFCFGLVWTLAAERAALSPETRAVVLTGFMGAFTTFSTFMFETGELVRAGQWLLAVANVAGQSVLGLAAVFGGWALARML